MIEATEALFDPKRSNQVANSGVVVTHVIAELSLSLKLVRSLRRKDYREDRAPILTALSLGASTSADKLKVDLVHDCVGDVTSKVCRAIVVRVNVCC